MAKEIIKFIGTPEGLFALIAIVVAIVIGVVNFFISKNKKVMKQKSGDNSENYQGDNMQIQNETKIRR